ncbi:hypothetical protein MBLNU459_g3873t1 [Dothideomycetes sp. NU459]
MAGFYNLVARSDAKDATYSPTISVLLIVLLVLVIIALLSVTALYFLRWRKRSQQEELPLYDEKRSSSRFNHRRLTVRPSESIIVYQEKQNLIANSEAPPTSPVPEIRITFPEEHDEFGKRQSGRVVVVRVGEHSIGLEPVSEEKLPAYQKSESDRFQSLDLERIGGLKEKDIEARYS